MWHIEAKRMVKDLAEIKIEEQTRRVAKLVDVASLVNLNICEPYSFIFCFPFAQDAT